jgi:hypothetical protein
MEIFGLKRVDIVEKKKRGRPIGNKNKKKVVTDKPSVFLNDVGGEKVEYRHGKNRIKK